jgi:hypothetical protein
MRVCPFGFEANANRHQIQINRSLVKCNIAAAKQYETS